MRRKLSVIVIALVLLCGCAHWSALTPEQKARAVADEIQDQLIDLYDTSKAYLSLHPEYETKWKAEILPAFDLANRSLKSTMELARMEVITPDEVRTRMIPFINSLVLYLVEIGLFD